MKVNDRCTVYDLETTGLIHEGGKPVELAAIQLQLGEGGSLYELRRYQAYILEPGRVCSAAARRVNGISQEVLLGKGISERKAFGRFAEFVDTSTLVVSFNGLAFDNILTNDAFLRCNIHQSITDADSFDVLRHHIARLRRQNKPRFVSYGKWHRSLPLKLPKKYGNSKLQDVAALNEVPPPRGHYHSAMTDAEVTAALFAKFNPFS